MFSKLCNSLDAEYERMAIRQGLVKRSEAAFPENLPEWGEPPPTHNTYPPVWDAVVQDMLHRKEFGKEKYGVNLQPFNGRNALKDAYEEVLDLAVYLKQKLLEDEHVR